MTGVPHRGKVVCPSCKRMVRVKPMTDKPHVYRARCDCGWRSKDVFKTDS